MMKRIHVVTILILLTLLALGFRIAYNKATRTNIQSDARQYAFYAYNLYKYGIYSHQENTENPEPDSFRSPGYPVLLYLAMVTSGTSGFYDTARMWQAFMSSLMVPLVFILGVRLGTGEKIAMSAAVLTSISPHLVSLSSYILTEVLFGFLILVSLVMLIEAVKRENPVWGVCAGIFSGMAYLTNEVFLFLPLILVFYTLYFKKRLPGSVDIVQPHKIFGKKNLVVAASILIFFLAFPTGWTIRNNTEAFSEGAPGSSRALQSLAHGSYPGFTYKDPRLKYYPYRDDPRNAEYTSSFANFKRIFLERFKEKPLRYILWYAFEKPYYVWSWNILQGMGDVYIYPVRQSLFTENSLANAIRVAMKAIHPVLMAACLGGLILLLARVKRETLTSSDGDIAFLFLVMLYVTSIYTVFASWPRYSVPLRPVFYLAASWSIFSMWELVKHWVAEKEAREKKRK